MAIFGGSGGGANPDLLKLMQEYASMKGGPISASGDGPISTSGSGFSERSLVGNPKDWMAALHQDTPDLQRGGLGGLIDKGVNALGGADKLSQIGAVLQAGAGNSSMLDYLSRQQGQKAGFQHDSEMADRAAERQAAEMQGVSLGNGGFGTFSQKGGLNVVREPRTPDPRTDAQQNWEYMSKLTPEKQAQFRGILPNYGSTQAVYDLKEKLKRTVPGKAPGAARSSVPKLPSGFILDQ